MSSHYIPLSYKMREELDRMRFTYNITGGRTPYMPQTRHGGDVQACEDLCALGFALESHLDAQEEARKARNPVSRLLMRIVNALMFPDGVVRRYHITPKGLEYANAHIENLNP